MPSPRNMDWESWHTEGDAYAQFVVTSKGVTSTSVFAVCMETAWKVGFPLYVMTKFQKVPPGQPFSKVCVSHDSKHGCVHVHIKTQPSFLFYIGVFVVWTEIWTEGKFLKLSISLVQRIAALLQTADYQLWHFCETHQWCNDPSVSLSQLFLLKSACVPRAKLCHSCHTISQQEVKQNSWQRWHKVLLSWPFPLCVKMSTCFQFFSHTWAEQLHNACQLQYVHLGWGSSYLPVHPSLFQYTLFHWKSNPVLPLQEHRTNISRICACDIENTNMPTNLILGLEAELNSAKGVTCSHELQDVCDWNIDTRAGSSTSNAVLVFHCEML